MIREYVHIANCIIPLRLTGIKPGFITMLQPIRGRQRRFQRRSTKSLYQGKLCIDPLPPFFFLPPILPLAAGETTHVYRASTATVKWKRSSFARAHLFRF